MQGWIYLICAILLEVAGTISMKLCAGFSKLWPSVTMIICYALSFASLTLALKQIDVSSAYAVWSGVGILLLSIIGFLYFKESMSVLKISSLGLIIIGVAGLYLVDKVH